MGNIFEFKVEGGKKPEDGGKKPEKKIEVFNDWEKRVGKVARSKEFCEASMILAARKNPDDEVEYVLAGLEGMFIVPEVDLFNLYEILD